MIISAKILALVVIAVLTGGALVPSRYRTNFWIVSAILIVSIAGSYYLFQDIARDVLEAKDKSSEQKTSSINQIKFAPFVSKLALPKRDYFQPHGWFEAQRVLSEVAFPVSDDGNVYVNKSCPILDEEGSPGKVQLFFGNHPVMNQFKTELATWDVKVCGARVGIGWINLESGWISGEFDKVYSNIVKGLRDAGFTIAYVGSYGCPVEGWSHYKLSKQGMQNLILSVWSLGVSGGEKLKLQISFHDKPHIDKSLGNYCADQQVDRLNLT
jgi:hypothetical protein